MDHEVRDKFSLALARAIVAGLPAHPEWVEMARTNLARWSRLNADSPGLLRCYAEWQHILDQPVAAVAAVLVAETEEGQRLRQNSPFVGVLSPAQVWELKRRYAAKSA